MCLATIARAEPPYPPSPVIRDIVWAPADTILRRAAGSDNWPVTWADDDALYTAWGDGRGFEPLVPQKLSMGFGRIDGPVSSFAGVNIRSDAEQLGNGRSGRKGWGMLCVDGVLYLAMGHADGMGGQSQLAWSRDHAGTWEFADWVFPQFGLVGFVNYGGTTAGPETGTSMHIRTMAPRPIYRRIASFSCVCRRIGSWNEMPGSSSSGWMRPSRQSGRPMRTVAEPCFLTATPACGPQ